MPTLPSAAELRQLIDYHSRLYYEALEISDQNLTT